MVLALLLVGAAGLSLAGDAAAQTDRHRSYADAPDDDRIFLGILFDASDEATKLAEAAGGSVGPDGQVAGSTASDVEASAGELGSLTGGFTDELVEVIQAQGTPPPRLADLHDVVVVLDDAGQNLASSDLERQDALEGADLEDAAPPGDDGEETLVRALEALDAERAAVQDLRDAAGALEAQGLDPSDLEAALASLDDRLLAQRDLLTRELVRLDVPALLTLSVEDTTVEFGGHVTVSGLALSGGDPARGDQVTVRFADASTTTRVGLDGGYRASIPVPDALAAGAHDVQASATINGTDVAAGPTPVRLEPMTPRLTLEPATTVMPERGNLTLQGQLDPEPLAEGAGETVEITYRGEPVLEATTDDEGRYQATLDTTGLLGGHSTLQAHWRADDPRMTDAVSEAVSVFVPYTEIQRQARAQEADPVYTEFDFPRTGLGPVPDILAGITVLGLVVLVANAALAGGGPVLSVKGLSNRIRFQKLTTFHLATEEDKYHADPRNAYPPLDASRREVGELYEAFLEGVREFESVPPSLTHRDLAAFLRDEGVPREEAGNLARWYELARYHPRRPADDDDVRAAFERAWEHFVATRDIDGKPWPTLGPDGS